ncbi:hypothetical protein B0H14DRAFT_3879608 [Mycena olivaceomarginata]|nr:hypothetical protein B0H14DRAFT_3879608 [Mycena olivaceomarginata]
MTDTGRLPQMGFELNSMRSANKSVNKFCDWIAAGVSKAKAALVKAKDKFKLPFKVMQVVGKGAYKLELPPALLPAPPKRQAPPVLRTDRDKRWEVAKTLEATGLPRQPLGHGAMERVTDTIDAYYRGYPNAPCQIALATFDSLSFQRCDRTICFICRDTVFQGGVMSGEPLLRLVFQPFLWPLSPFQPDLLQMVFHPMLWMVFRPPLWILLHPSIRLYNHPGHLSALAGTGYVIRPGITLPVSPPTNPNSAAASNSTGQSSTLTATPSDRAQPLTNPSSTTSPAPTPPPASNAQQSSTSISQSMCTDWAGNIVTIDITSFTPPPLPPVLVSIQLLGGTALICLIGFVWKLALADGENIKWPELNAPSDSGAGEDHALPVMQGAYAHGFVGGDGAPSTYPPSTAVFHAAQDDPYAVPPLPHMNPGLGEPYRDDPNGVHGAPPADWDGEAIAMTQMGRASPRPGPGVMYTGHGRTESPAPGMYADARTTSPGPQAAYGGM